MNRVTKHWLSLIVVMVLAVLVIGTVIWSRSGNSVSEKKKIGDFHTTGLFRIQVAIDPEQPKIGNNQLTIVVYDKHDRPVDDAVIEAVAVMPAMGSMPAMHAPAEISAEGAGLYRGSFELPMAGAWPLTINIKTAASVAMLSFAMNTSSTGLRLTSATPDPDGNPMDRPASSLSAGHNKPSGFTVDAYRRQLIGVTTAKATYQLLTKTIRAPAIVTYDETRLSDINLKFDGWIGTLNADAVGKRVKKGQTLFTVYSPALVAAQDEYLHARRRSRMGGEALRLAARRRLTAWDFGPSSIRALEQRDHAADYIPIRSPVSGTVIDKKIVTGSAVKAGMSLLRIADLTKVWVEGQVYESELPLVEVGMAAEVVLPDQSERTINGSVSFVYPFLEGATRTARVRIELPNPEGLLRPEQYALLRLTVNLGKRLVVPASAVLYAGEVRIVFLDQGEGRLEPRTIKTGLRNDDLIEVLDGLKEGDVVVSSGNFLISAESQLKAGLEQW